MGVLVSIGSVFSSIECPGKGGELKQSLSSNQQPQTLQQFIESNKTQYGIQKGTQASNEYIAIITPYVNQIVSLESQLKALQEKLTKKE